MFAEPCGPKTERGGLLAETPKPPRFRLWEPLYIAQSGARPVLASAKPGADSRFWALFSAREMSAAVIHVSRLFPGNICLKAGRPRGVAELAKERDPAARPLATRPRKGLRGPTAGIAAHREGGQGLRVSEARTGACRSEGERGYRGRRKAGGGWRPGGPRVRRRQPALRGSEAPQSFRERHCLGWRTETALEPRRCRREDRATLRLRRHLYLDKSLKQGLNGRHTARANRRRPPVAGVSSAVRSTETE